ncbi:MAG: histidine kinase [Wenzhouxiangellaceae bacterium]|nr:histidine kinase [Wenzhouxiangellaceae bacterium]
MPAQRASRSRILKPADTRIRVSELPDFCQPQAVLLLTLLGLLLATLLTLADHPGFAGFWISLGLSALLIEAVILTACLLLCSGRRALLRLPAWAAYATIFAVIQAIVALYTWIGMAQAPALVAPELGLGAVDLIIRNVLISSIASLVFLRYLILHRQWQRQVTAESSARLAALQARIRPHFLFNALNAIAGLVRTRPEEAEDAIVDLSELLRTGLREDPRHTLAEEIELVRGYLRIEQLRLGDRLHVAWELADDLPTEQPIPALLLQPLVENAVLHGAASSPDGGSVSIHGERHRRGAWSITVDNAVAPQHKRQAAGNRIALDNVRKRLALAYGDRARCVVERGVERFRVRLVIPEEGGRPD